MTQVMYVILYKLKYPVSSQSHQVTIGPTVTQKTREMPEEDCPVSMP